MHARDPHHRVDTLRSSRRVQVLAGGQVVADSVRPLLLFETTLPTRYATSVCPCKGRARYWSIRAGGTFIKDVAWSYPDPIPENPKVRDLVAFFQERVDIVVDGQALARPATPWSTTDGVAPGDAVHRDR